MPRMGLIQRRHRPLVTFLSALPAEQTSICLTLKDLIAVLGAPGGSPAGIPHWTVAGVARAFRHRAGFAATIDRDRWAIVFTRLPHQQPAHAAPVEA